MTTAIATRPELGSQVEQVLMSGDLTRLSADQRVSYYHAVCNSVGLNPLTQPFAYLNLNGKLVLYAGKNCAEQLRDIHGVSVESMDDKVINDVCIVTVKVSNKKGRADMAKGAVNVKGLSGEALANAIMKAETKAKRRATLSICGLGMLDETEVDSIPGAVKHGPKDHGGPQYSPPTLSPSAEYAAPSDQSPAPSMAKEGVMRLAETVEVDEQVSEEYTETVPVFDSATGEEIGQRSALTSPQNKHIHALLNQLGHHMDDVKGRERIERGKYKKKLREKFCKAHTNELSTVEASWAIEWLLKCVAKLERAMGPANDLREAVEQTAQELTTKD